jgi:hypothetical protein
VHEELEILEIVAAELVENALDSARTRFFVA